VSSFRVWLFRGLIILVLGLMMVSWLLPWWSASVDTMPGIKAPTVIALIHPYGLEQHGGRSFLPSGATEMPIWFVPLMWIYLGVCVAAFLYALWVGEKVFEWSKLKFKLAKVLIGGVGLSYILVAVSAVILAAIRIGEFGMLLVGESYVSTGWVAGTEVNASLLSGYFLAHGVGVMCIALALLRDKIVGKTELSKQRSK